jgi:hypothetical protein
MRHPAAILIGLAVVAGTGVVHGVWTHRWQPSARLEAAIHRLDDFPGDLGRWHANVIELPQNVVDMAGASRSCVRRYVHEGNGNTLFVSLLVGPTGQMAVHRPEHCYVATGYEQSGGAVRVPITLSDGSRVELLTSRFERQQPGGKEQLRIFWTWKAGNDWRAPESPRWSLADQPYVYKLYVVRETSSRADRMEEDPAVEFLKLLLPRLNEVLAEK